jgi:hypothetical protein
MPIGLTCQHCGKAFSVPPSALTYGYGKYCSQQCVYAARRAAGRVRVKCQHCGKSFSIIKSRRGANGRNYCSRECYDATRPLRWGRVNGTKVFHQDCERWYWHWSTRDGAHRSMAYSRYVWSQTHGPIPPGWHIHHKDGNKLNDDLHNLEALPAGVHERQHHTKDELWHIDPNGTLRRKCSDCGEFKPREEYRKTGRQRKWPSYCKSCESIRNRKRYQERKTRRLEHEHDGAPLDR